jgi:hypothetical protein
VILALGWSLRKLKRQPRSAKIGFTNTPAWKRYREDSETALETQAV